MLIYLFFLAIPLVTSLFYSPSKQKGGWMLWLFFIPLFVFTGLRNKIGPDWIGYSLIYDSTLYTDFSDISITSEPGFFLVNKLSEAMGWELYGVMAICAFIFIYGIFSYALKTPNPWMAVAVVTPYLVFVISMSGIRQAAAIGFGYFMLSHDKEYLIYTKLLIIALAMSFHTSAAIFLLFLIFDGKDKKGLRLLGVIGVGIFLAMSLNDTGTTNRYQREYIEINIVSGGALFHVLLSAFPAALYLLLRKKIVLAVGANPTVDMASYMVLAALPLLLISSTGVDRLTLYFSFIQMWIYPALIKTYKGSYNVVKFSIFVLILFVFFVFFMFGTHAYTYLPYNNILFD